MKLNAALAKSLLMAASMGMVVPVLAQTAPKKNSPPSDAPNPAPAEEPEPQLPGSVIAREDGGFLSLTVEDNHFKLTFYNAKKKPVSADAIRALLRWNPVNKSGDERSILNPTGDDTSLQGTTIVRPPFVFKVYITLIGADGKTLETHVVDFRG
jgi:hypothetical protein